MTSPVDTSVKHFTSAMPGAPALTGAIGSLIALLDACLVDGFGSKTATSLVVASGIATLTFTGGASAALVDSVIVVAGATPSGLNGEQKVLTATATTVTFATGESNGSATGTITFKMAPAGWTKAFTGTNLAAYKSADVAASGCYLRVADTTTLSARVVGYETMSDVNTGTGPFPTTAQISGGGYWIKSASATLNNAWVIASDGRFFTLWIAPYFYLGDAYTGGITRCFGDIKAFRPGGDAYGCTLSYGTSTSSADTSNGIDTGNGNQVMARNVAGLGTAALHVSYPYVGTTTSFSGKDTLFGNFPSTIDGKLILSPRYYKVSGNFPPRGDVPGLYSVPQTDVGSSFSWGVRIAGADQLSGRNLISITPGSSPASSSASDVTGVSFIDVTGPWR